MEFGEVGEVAALNQRIRRVLSVLRTIAAHMGAGNGNCGESALHLCGRIGALGRVALQPVLIDGVDLESLVLDELLAYAAPAERFFISGAEVRLPLHMTEWVGLLVHELATNSVKYGALSQPRAKIKIGWEMKIHHGERILRFEWLESGLGMFSPSAPGFGRVLVEQLIARHLKGEGKMTFLPGGVRCTIAIPMADPRGCRG